jgi:hypothetical protein
MGALSNRNASVTRQALALAQRFPDSTLRRNGRLLIWRGRMQPTPISRTYLIEVRYQYGWPPKTRVVSQLRTRTGKSLPHVWHHQHRVLCLYQAEDWNPRMLIANTIVPWASEWLLFYEVWLVTGGWDGGGQWPPTSDQTT